MAPVTQPAARHELRIDAPQSQPPSAQQDTAHALEERSGGSHFGRGRGGVPPPGGRSAPRSPLPRSPNQAYAAYQDTTQPWRPQAEHGRGRGRGGRGGGRAQPPFHEHIQPHRCAAQIPFASTAGGAPPPEVASASTFA